MTNWYGPLTYAAIVALILGREVAYWIGDRFQLLVARRHRRH